MKKVAPYAVALSTLLATACGVSHGESFGYVTNSPLSTVNAATPTGYYEHAQQLDARVYPGLFIRDTHNQFVPNTDMGTAVASKDSSGNTSIYYTLSATYSDGQPLTCVDFLASYKLGYQPMYSHVRSLECTGLQNNFRVVMDPGYQWQALFGPGTIMPAHVLADAVGIDIDNLVLTLNEDTSAGSTGQWPRDPETGELVSEVDMLATLRQQWSSLFSLNNFSRENFPSYGPYTITAVDSMGDGRRITLEANPNYRGAAPAQSPLEVYSRGALPENNKDIFAADFDGTLSWLDRDKSNGDYAVTAAAGTMIESLVFDGQGLFADVNNRKALAACVDRDAVAAVSSEKSGVTVPAVTTRLIQQSTDSSSDSALPSPPSFSTQNLGEVRMGYYGDPERMEAMIESMKQSCAPSGTTIEIDNSNPDVILAAVDPATHFGYDISNPYSLRLAESQLWDSVLTIPLAAQPRLFAAQRGLCNFSTNTSASGLGWNMDRWQEDT
ncbi:MAG: ABC transporter substrate-binding protein [Corynebacterium sp.]|nr:ABC transporter substrate-binding protein [Corynebacterium sp.]